MNLTNLTYLFNQNIFSLVNQQFVLWHYIPGVSSIDHPEFDGNTILLEFEDNEYVYNSGCEITKFKTNDKIVDYISLIGNNVIPYTFAIGEKCTYFISKHYKFIENYKIEEGTLLNATNNSLDPFDYHLEKCGVDSFKTLEKSQIHTFYTHNEEGV